jgi:hypothetical protein
MTGPVVVDPEGRRTRLSPARVVVAVLIVGMVAMWVYVLYLAFGPGRQAPPDRLDDPTFATAAQARCEQALREVGRLPRAAQARSAVERATVVAKANESFAAMLDDLDRLVPGGEDGKLVRAWLADWRTYLRDREAYATALRTDPDARLLVSPKNSQQITEYLDAFAGDNRMVACATPIDV